MKYGKAVQMSKLFFHENNVERVPEAEGRKSEASKMHKMREEIYHQTLGLL